MSNAKTVPVRIDCSYDNGVDIVMQVLEEAIRGGASDEVATKLMIGFVAASISAIEQMMGCGFAGRVIDGMAAYHRERLQAAAAQPQKVH